MNRYLVGAIDMRFSSFDPRVTGELLHLFQSVLTVIEHENQASLTLDNDKLISALDFFLIPRSPNTEGDICEDVRGWYTNSVGLASADTKPFLKIILRFRETWLHMKRKDLSVNDLLVFAKTLGADNPLPPDAMAKLMGRVRSMDGIASENDMAPIHQRIEAHRAAVLLEIESALFAKQDVQEAKACLEKYRATLSALVGDALTVALTLAEQLQTCRGMRLDFPKWDEPDAVWKAFVLSKSSVGAFIKAAESLVAGDAACKEVELDIWKMTRDEASLKSPMPIAM
jgi:hypothetical protein